MGWRAIDKVGNETSEETDGRPVQAGEEGKLLVIAQEDFGHKVAIDLLNGIIFFDYETLAVQNGTLELEGYKYVIFICDDTNIGADLFGVEASTPNKEGWYENKIKPLIWRPIWFTRYTQGVPTKIIGAQTTMPPEFGGHNVKKQVMLFVDGRIGIS